MVKTMLGQVKKEVDIFQGIIEAGGKLTVFEAVGTNDLGMISEASERAIHKMSWALRGMNERVDLTIPGNIHLVVGNKLG